MSPENRTGTSRERTPTPRWWRIGVCAVLPVLVGAACVVLLGAQLQPVMPFIVVILVGWVFVLLGSVWLALALIRLWRYRPDRRLWITPGIVVATAVVSGFGIPSWIGWHMSKGELEQRAATCEPSLDDIRIGVYKVRQVTSEAGGCHFITRGGLFNSVGVAHLPQGTDKIGNPEAEGDIGYRHFHGDWYTFTAIVF
ncbi:DUF4175 domain-containing protein [Rhodococcus sp. HNM0563]|uniref:hypothetical protein n=1 Tax=Rhodococcus sp. HNM0563 TaxID=2716339 RepID=UPI00146B93F2|nr:hypothetical protein [Rhodococcus sp. HNM0563]NLU63167.1 DUF4175 domain-containing protein [Rhodococcus sp. HNM0563]